MSSNTLLVILLVLLVVQTYSYIKVDPVTKFFIDDDGRVRIYHGVNAVYKVPPYHPDLYNFNPQNSLNAKDISDLYEWGFNFIRLGTMWPGVAPARGSYNQTYLNVLGTLVGNLATANISVLLDCHQDLLSPFFCGEGAPDWAVSVPNTSLAFPIPSLLTTLPTDPKTGYPLIEDCLQYTFSRFYLADATGCAFQSLYDDVNGIRTSFGNYWQVTAAFFKQFSNVIGYEIINEPWVGDMYSDPALLIQEGYADKKNLQPFYDYISSRIRSIDNNRLIFFESSLADAVLSNEGFDHVPGGSVFNTTSVYSYHIYCGLTKRNGEPINNAICDLQETENFASYFDDAKKLGAGSFLTEWGNMPNNLTDEEAINYITMESDNYLQSWSWWQFKSFHDITTTGLGTSESFYDENGELQEMKVKALSRTYAYAIAGIPTKMSFDPDTSVFQLSYTAKQINFPTEIYLNEKYYYPGGFVVQTTPSSVTWNRIAPLNRIAIVHSPDIKQGDTIQVTITPIN